MGTILQVPGWMKPGPSAQPSLRFQVQIGQEKAEIKPENVMAVPSSPGKMGGAGDMEEEEEVDEEMLQIATPASQDVGSNEGGRRDEKSIAEKLKVTLRPSFSARFC